MSESNRFLVVLASTLAVACTPVASNRLPDAPDGPAACVAETEAPLASDPDDGHSGRIERAA